MRHRRDPLQQRNDVSPLVAVLAFRGGPFDGTRCLWINLPEPIRLRDVDKDGHLGVSRGDLRADDLGVYRATREYLEDDDWVIELGWIGRD